LDFGNEGRILHVLSLQGTVQWLCTLSRNGHDLEDMGTPEL
jgi:hypothetical protein